MSQEGAQGSQEGSEQAELRGSTPGPARGVESVPARPRPSPAGSGLEAKAPQPANLPPYHVAARMIGQGALSGAAAAPPATLFLLVASLLDGVAAPTPLVFFGVSLFFVAVFAVWGAALTAAEEFARRGGRSVRRMVALSLGFPLFATVATIWISGVSEGGPAKGVYLLKVVLKDIAGEFRREPAASWAMTFALVLPFLGLLLVRRWQREHEPRRLGTAYYGSTALLGLAAGLCVAFANFSWGQRLVPHEVLLGLSGTTSLLLAFSWGLAKGRTLVDAKIRRYQDWADAD